MTQSGHTPGFGGKINYPCYHPTGWPWD